MGFVVFEGKELKNKQTIQVPLALPAHIGTPEGGDEEAYLRTKTDLTEVNFPSGLIFLLICFFWLANRIIWNKIWQNWLRGGHHPSGVSGFG